AMKTLILCVLLAGAFAAPSRKPTFRRGLNKIVGGTDAKPGELPYQLSFQDISFGFAWHFCGASIYNENWAICAGHCVQGEDMNNPDYLQVVAGELNQDVDEGTEQTVILSKIIQHEDYNGFTISNDISLLKLSQPLSFNDNVRAIDIPAQGHAAS
ncbi:serine protease, partial [Salmonella sp. NW445]|uniref:serine protease n=1 Tax=Salmonella sp. NW445 TaxID=2947996 RepID=UPI003F42BD28